MSSRTPRRKPFALHSRERCYMHVFHFTTECKSWRSAITSTRKVFCALVAVDCFTGSRKIFRNFRVKKIGTKGDVSTGGVGGRGSGMHAVEYTYYRCVCLPTFCWPVSLGGGGPGTGDDAVAVKQRLWSVLFDAIDRANPLTTENTLVWSFLRKRKNINFLCVTFRQQVVVND